MMWKLIVMAMTCLIAAGCTSTSYPPQPKSPVQRYTLTKPDIFVIRMGLLGSVRDPDSLVFGDSKAIKHDNGLIEVCGTVNGKNGFGGYTGFVPYNGILGPNSTGERVFVVAGFGDGGSGSYAVLKLCREHGIM